MARKSYVLRIKCAHSLADLITLLQTNRIDVVSLREHLAAAPASPTPDRTERKRRVMSDEGKATVTQSLEHARAVHAQRVEDALTPILKANQFAPIERIVAEMNKTDVKTWNNTPFTARNIQGYLNRTLDKLTNPAPDCVA